MFANEVDLQVSEIFGMNFPLLTSSEREAHRSKTADLGTFRAVRAERCLSCTNTGAVVVRIPSKFRLSGSEARYGKLLFSSFMRLLVLSSSQGGDHRWGHDFMILLMVAMLIHCGKLRWTTLVGLRISCLAASNPPTHLR